MHIDPIKTKIRNRLVRHIILPIYYSIYLPYRVKQIRKKERIKVLFVLQELSQWKTEGLYLAMLQHPRMEPILGITECIEFPGIENKIKDYCSFKKYEFITLDTKENLIKQVSPDIIIHQKPYQQHIHPAHTPIHNIKAPCVFVPYTINTIIGNWTINEYLNIRCWQLYFENQITSEERKPIHFFHGNNYVVTGLPVMDELSQPKDNYPNPWPDNGKKRIIYAPHHTIPGYTTAIGYSTFLENCDFMLQMLEKYKDKIHFVFKPHPRLYENLINAWGKEKADNYYNKWRNASNGGIEEGNYISLFKHSDALIHDCASFTVEYMYTINPVMYLIKDVHHDESLSQLAKEAFNLHYKGLTHEDIESFINNVIKETDPLKNQRQLFYQSQLLPPYGKTACENIINSILGIEEYA